MTGDAARAAELPRVPLAVERALELEPASREMAEMYRGMSRCVVLGRGYNYTSAHPGPCGAACPDAVTGAGAGEWALPGTVKELAYVPADPYSSADFQHGPIAIVVGAVHVGADHDPPLLSWRSRRRAQCTPTCWVCCANCGMRCLRSRMARRRSISPTLERAMRIPGGLPEWLTPLVSIVPSVIT